MDRKVFVVAVFAVILACVSAFHLSSTLSSAERSRLIQTLKSTQSSSGKFADAFSAFHASGALVLLSSSLAKNDAACAQAIESLNGKLSLQDLFYNVATAESLKCQNPASASVISSIKTALESDTLDNLYYAAGAVSALAANGHVDVSQFNWEKVAETIDRLSEESGLYRQTPSTRTSDTASAAHAIATLAVALKSSKGNPRVRDVVTSAIDRIESLLDTGVATDEWFILESYGHSSLYVTSTTLTAINALMDAAKDFTTAQPLTSEHIVKMADFFMAHRHSKAANDIFHMLSGLRICAANKFFRPVSVSVADAVVVVGGGDDKIDITVADAEGTPLTTCTATLTKAVSSSRQTVLTNAAFAHTKDGNYETDLIGPAKSAPGLYNIAVNVRCGEHYVNVDKFEFTAKVVSAAYPAKATITAGSNSISAEYPRAAAGALAVTNQNIKVQVRVATAEKKNFNSQQVFVVLTQGSFEHTAVATVVSNDADGNTHVATINARNIPKGSYTVTIIVGDALIENPTSWVVGNVNVESDKNLPEQSATDKLYTPKKDMEHIFNAAPKRPAATIATVFVGAVLAPLLVLFIGLGRVGINFGNFPGGATAPFALAFIGLIGASCFTIATYWFGTTIFTAVYTLGLLAIPTFFIGHRVLRHLADERIASKSQ